MSSHPLGLVAWRTTANYGLWHWEHLTYPFNVLCPASPPRANIGVQRRNDSNGIPETDICANCRAELERQTRRKVKVAR